MKRQVMNMSQKVLLGLSGGVDSAVAAYLLKEQGYDVTCAFMRNWDSFANNDIMGNPTIQDDVCPQEQDYLDAKAVADKLGLPLLRVDFVKEYWDHVFTYFLEEYRKGRTPNPDILCNKYIKFDAFMEEGLALIPWQRVIMLRWIIALRNPACLGVLTIIKIRHIFSVRFRRMHCGTPCFPSDIWKSKRCAKLQSAWS